MFDFCSFIFANSGTEEFARVPNLNSSKKYAQTYAVDNVLFFSSYVQRWNFCCSKSNVSYSGSWHSEHSAFRRSFELDCGTNSFVSGLVTNVSHIWQDRIWSIHCSDTHPTHALVNCSWTIRYGALVDFYVPNSVSVIAAIRSVIIPNTRL